MLILSCLVQNPHGTIPLLLGIEKIGMHETLSANSELGIKREKVRKILIILAVTPAEQKEFDPNKIQNTCTGTLVRMKK